MLNKLQQEPNPEPREEPRAKPPVFGRKVGLISRLIGCSHRNLSRPFVEGESSYKSCLNCGARRQFNPKTFETHGQFYYPPVG